MDKEKLERISFLSKKSKTKGLTESELKEQSALREEYLNSIKNNLRKTLDNISIMDECGNKTKLKKKN